MHILGFTLFSFIFLSMIWKVYAVHDRKYKRVTPHRVKRHLIPRDTHNLPPCSDDHLMLFLAQLKAINPESIINLATEEDTTGKCRELSESLDAIDDYLGTCRIVTQGLYVQLIKGVDALYDHLCNSTYGREFYKYIHCYQALHNDYAACVGPGDWVEFTDHNLICSAYQDITDCYYVKTAKVCGLKAAKTMKALNKAVINKVIGIRCCNINKNPKVIDAYKGQSAILQQDITVMGLGFLILSLFSI